MSFEAFAPFRVTVQDTDIFGVKEARVRRSCCCTDIRKPT